jgi:hypothetical protein
LSESGTAATYIADTERDVTRRDAVDLLRVCSADEMVVAFADGGCWAVSALGTVEV